MDSWAEKLIAAALLARERAYAPYSSFKVGAALLTARGKIYTGCNVENASYGLTVCAERVALYNAVSEGEREFTALAIVSDGPSITVPCGACRQVLAEFSRDLKILMGNSQGGYVAASLEELFPLAFTLDAAGEAAGKEGNNGRGEI
ncbi:cytidine deaminase [Desulfovirgula thermocuniculi]|uniref:cytidine deaminase n=1 Tax=Desulfovirgula thermocuniculi TaxID=348842 RepID=UPI001B7FE52E|nr:cytidine deaminase [Desulfovirgula thermocuniculi]